MIARGFAGNTRDRRTTETLALRQKESETMEMDEGAGEGWHGKSFLKIASGGSKKRLEKPETLEYSKPGQGVQFW